MPVTVTKGKFGSAGGWLLVDGYSLTSMKLKNLRYKFAAKQEETTGLGDTWQEFTPAGQLTAEIAQDGGYFDTNANAGHAALNAGYPTTPQGATRVLCLGLGGQTKGYPFVGMEGVYQQSYDVAGAVGDLTKANAEYAMVGRLWHGEILQELAAKTADWNTKTDGQSVDSGAGTSNGGYAFLHVTAYSGFTNCIFKIRHSTDDTSYADLVTFATISAAPGKEIIVVAPATPVNRYLCVDGNVTGSGSITAWVGLARG